MKAKTIVRAFFAAALLAAVALVCACPLWENVNCARKDGDAGSAIAASMNEAAKVDFDFTKMNSTVLMSHMYRLAANPKEFVGKTLRISGMFLTRVDASDGKRYFGCLMGDPGECSCCAPGGVFEFMPKDPCVWPTDFPPLESRITVIGRLQMFEVGDNNLRHTEFSIPRLVDAEIVPKANQ